MIIDCILDRKDDFKYGRRYNAHDFYFNVFRYDGHWRDEITKAMDYGTEDDVRKALCGYIDVNEYNPLIKDYINGVNWIYETPYHVEAAAIFDFETKHAAAEKAAKIQKLISMLKRGYITATECENLIAGI